MVKVIKKDGKTQAFSPAKIRKSVSRASMEANLTPDESKQLVKDVADPLIDSLKKKETVKTSAIGKSLLAKLDNKEKAVADSWKTFKK